MSRDRLRVRQFAAGAVAGGVATMALAAAGRVDPAPARWTRRNFRGREVSLLLGPAIGLGAAAGVVAVRPAARREVLGLVVSAAGVGLYDDLYGDRHAKGLGGHARALRHGRLTTGVIKLVTLTGAGAIGSWRAHRQPVDTVLGTILVAGGANLVNLFDLRPGRAAKVSLLAAAALAGSSEPDAAAIAAVIAGLSVAALPADLGEQAMLGDAGAGTLGALLGWSAATGGSRWRRAGLAAAVIALTGASERVSFSAVIERHAMLRALDRLGRQPA